ncbi:MAG: hypothetical protein R6X20_02970 [Phycisphaerae bacterium]
MNTRREIIRSLVKVVKIEEDHVRIIYRVGPALLLTAAQAAQLLNVVHTFYSAILREISKKGDESRFEKVERGKFQLAK